LGFNLASPNPPYRDYYCFSATHSGGYLEVWKLGYSERCGGDDYLCTYPAFLRDMLVSHLR